MTDIVERLEKLLIVGYTDLHVKSNLIRDARDEIVRLRERLDAGPFGEDAIDVTESSADYLRDEIARLRDELNALHDAIAQAMTVCRAYEKLGLVG